jgi:transcriptional regulator with XRE-family HTH domain
MPALLDSLLSKDDMQEFAARLREARLARKMTQARLAELLEVDTRVYHRWERGGALPQLDAVARIAQVLQISADSLLGLDAAKDAPVIHNPRLHALWQQVDSLSDEDQQALFVLMDSVLKRAQMAKLLTT